MTSVARLMPSISEDRKSTRLNSSHTEIYTLSLHDALPISQALGATFAYIAITSYYGHFVGNHDISSAFNAVHQRRSEEHTSELQSHRDLHSFPTRRSSDLAGFGRYLCLHRHNQLLRPLCRQS